jgi:hypothetical protein
MTPVLRGAPEERPEVGPARVRLGKVESRRYSAVGATHAPVLPGPKEYRSQTESLLTM